MAFIIPVAAHLASAPSAHALEYSTEEVRDYSLRTIGSLKIINRRGDVRVRGWALDKVRVRGVRLVEAVSQEDADRLLSTASFQYKEREGHIEVVAEYGRGLDIRERLQERKDPRVRMDLEIQAPSGVALDVWSVDGKVNVESWRSAVTVRAANGAVSLRRVNGSQVRITCTDCPVTLDDVRASVRVSGGAGPLKAQDVSGGEVYLETTAGDLDLKAVRGRQTLVTDAGHIVGRELQGVVDFQTRKGNVDVVKVSGQLSGHTESGHMRLEVSRWAPEDKSLLESDGGNIELTLPPDLSAEVEVRSVAGNARVEFPLKSLPLPEVYGPTPASHRIGRVGGGGKMLKVFSKDGNVSVLRGR